ncbi:MAG: serine/threonine protein kinase, partial [Nitrospiraceae bacterium]
MEDLTGKQLGRYRVISPIGEGGMATVYKAYQPGMDRHVALKILPQQYARDAEFTGRFEQEAKVIAKLQHPHVLPVHDYGEADSYTYIVMPLVETGTLGDLLRSKTPLSLPRIRIIVTQVGDALDYAHSQGLIHRDVKPSNILIDNRGNCLLTDFGIAKMVEGTKHFTQTGGIVGTPHYMSPEQGSGGGMTHRSDVYSLGVVLYEMATGRVPFDAETPMAVVIKHMTDPLPPPSRVNPGVSPALESVILKAMAKPPDDRFESASAMVRALRLAIPEAAVAREPSQVGTVPTEDLTEAEAKAEVEARESLAEVPEEPSQARRLTPVLVGVGALVAVAICGLAAFAVGRAIIAPAADTTSGTVEAQLTLDAALGDPGPTAASLVTLEPGETEEPGQISSTNNALGRVAMLNASPSELPSARWPVSITDSFDTNENQWNPFQDFADEFGQRSFTFQRGRYRWDVVPSRIVSMHDTPQMDLISDFVFSVDVEQVRGPDSADYGVVFNEVAADVFYNFRISDTRQYSLQMNNGGTWSTLLDWTASPA